jgi:hypothetical protein
MQGARHLLRCGKGLGLGGKTGDAKQKAAFDSFIVWLRFTVLGVWAASSGMSGSKLRDLRRLLRHTALAWQDVAG